MTMQIIEYGNRTPKMNRILISGSALTGKSVTAAKFASSPDRAFFISTDHNAINQGYKGIKFEFPRTADKMMDKIIEALDLAEKVNSTWDALIVDLTEDYDERMQTLLRSEFEKAKDKRAVWGKITSLYKDFQTLLMTRFSDRTIIFLTREVEEEIKNKWGDVIKVKHHPALRETLRNQLLKDQDAEIRMYFDERGNRQVDIGKQRYPENAQLLNDILNKPLPTFTNPNVPHKPVAQPQAPTQPQSTQGNTQPPVTSQQPVATQPQAEVPLKQRIANMVKGAESKATKELGQDIVIEDKFANMILNSATFEDAQKLIKKWASELGL